MKNWRYLVSLSLLLFLVACQRPATDQQVVSEKAETELVSEESEEEDLDYDAELWEAQWNPDIYEEPSVFEFAGLPVPKPELIESGSEADGYHERLQPAWQAFEDETTHSESIPIPEDVEILGEYRIEGDSLVKSKGKLTAEQDEIVRYNFNLFVRLVPADYRADLAKVEVVNHNFYAAMIKHEKDNPSEQILSLNPSLLKSKRSKLADDFSTLLLFVHELAHLYSMHPDETLYGYYMFDPLGETVDGFKNNSYMNQFNQYFWKSVSEHYRDNLYKPREDFQKFYELNKNKFVTDYAASNPYEDFAESFVSFVISYAPFDEVEEPKYEKVNFFYQYRELVELRAKLLENMVTILGL